HAHDLDRDLAAGLLWPSRFAHDAAGLEVEVPRAGRGDDSLPIQGNSCAKVTRPRQVRRELRSPGRAIQDQRRAYRSIVGVVLVDNPEMVVLTRLELGRYRVVRGRVQGLLRERRGGKQDQQNYGVRRFFRRMSDAAKRV